jgi:hypothetical protein
MHARSLRVLRWLLPWAWAVSVSTAIAFAADQGLVRVLTPAENPAQASLASAGQMRQIQIVLLHADRPSTVLECTAYASNVTADVLEFWEAAEVQHAIHSICATEVVLVDGTGRPR